MPPGVSPFDYLRRKHLAAITQRTQRNTILYATRWTQGGGDSSVLSITPEDVHGFMEVIHGLTGSKLDLILHSPGGSAEATEALVSYIRSKFSDVRVIVPHAAMSAATMLACSANRIVLGKHSFLGPIDPQLIVQSEIGLRPVPAHAILEQFALAQKQCQNPAFLPSWLPMLKQYGPALIIQCQYAQDLSKQLVLEWLKRYMFANNPTNGQLLAEDAARALADHGTHKTHQRFLSRDYLKSLKLEIEDLETDQGFQDDVLSVYHATAHTFNGTPAAKIIENHLGKAFVKMEQALLIQRPNPKPPQQGKP